MNAKELAAILLNLPEKYQALPVCFLNWQSLADVEIHRVAITPKLLGSSANNGSWEYSQSDRVVQMVSQFGDGR